MSDEAIFRQAVIDILSDKEDAVYFSQETLISVVCKVSVEIGVDLQPEGNSQSWEKGVTIEYDLDEVGREADSGDTFTVGTTVYAVKAVLENDGFFVKVAVV